METRFDGSSINDGINNNTYELLFRDTSSLSEEEQGDKSYAKVLVTLNRFTRYEKRNILVKLKDFILKQYGFDVSKVKYNEDKDRYIYQDEDYSIPFNMISRLIDSDQLKKELLSEKRYGHCHVKSLCMGHNVPDSEVVTGYFTIYTNRVLHSILEAKDKDGNLIVLDWTRNITMPKEDYYRLTGFREVNRFAGSKFEEDFPCLQALGVGTKTYSCFRDELMKDFEKNKSLFKK